MYKKNVNPPDHSKVVFGKAGIKHHTCTCLLFYFFIQEGSESDATPVKHACAQTVANASTALTSQSMVEKAGLSSAVVKGNVLA